MYLTIGFLLRKSRTDGTLSIASNRVSFLGKVLEQFHLVMLEVLSEIFCKKELF